MSDYDLNSKPIPNEYDVVYEYYNYGYGTYLNSPNKKIHSEKHYHHGKLHRENGPAVIYYDYNESGEEGNIYCEEFYLNGQRHRIDGLAYISYRDGKVTGHEFYINNQLHSEVGPAVKHFNDEGKANYRKYYLFDKPIKVKSNKALIKYIKHMVLK